MAQAKQCHIHRHPRKRFRIVAELSLWQTTARQIDNDGSGSFVQGVGDAHPAGSSLGREGSLRRNWRRQEVRLSRQIPELEGLRRQSQGLRGVDRPIDFSNTDTRKERERCENNLTLGVNGQRQKSGRMKNKADSPLAAHQLIALKNDARKPNPYIP